MTTENIADRVVDALWDYLKSQPENPPNRDHRDEIITVVKDALAKSDSIHLWQGESGELYYDQVDGTPDEMDADAAEEKHGPGEFVEFIRSHI